MQTCDELKRFGLSDDQILEIAQLSSLMDAAKRLRAYLFEKWNMPLNVAADTVIAIKRELDC